MSVSSENSVLMSVYIGLSLSKGVRRLAKTVWGFFCYVIFFRERFSSVLFFDSIRIVTYIWPKYLGTGISPDLPILNQFTEAWPSTHQSWNTAVDWSAPETVLIYHYSTGKEAWWLVNTFIRHAKKLSVWRNLLQFL